MNAEIQTARELATHAADIAHLQEDMDKMAKDMAEIKVTLNSISNTLAEAKGGWKVLMMFGGAGGLVGAMVAQIIHSIPGGKL
jgi:cation transport ATPase